MDRGIYAALLYGESIIRGTVCANVRTYGSVGALGEQSPRATWPERTTRFWFGASVKKTDASKPAAVTYSGRSHRFIDRARSGHGHWLNFGALFLTSVFNTERTDLNAQLSSVCPTDVRNRNRKRKSVDVTRWSWPIGFQAEVGGRAKLVSD